jgi:CRP/FNR family transcriptional regulator
MKLTTGDLKKIKFFDHYSETQLETISKMSSIKEFKVKDILFEQYDELSEVFVLLEGSLSLGISLAKEKRIHLGSIEEGQLFSWSAVFSPYISTAWVMAMAPAKVIAIDAKSLIKKLKKTVILALKRCQKLHKQFPTGLATQGSSL